jgi:hypothetical protein
MATVSDDRLKCIERWAMDESIDNPIVQQLWVAFARDYAKDIAAIARELLDIRPLAQRERIRQAAKEFLESSR